MQASQFACADAETGQKRNECTVSQRAILLGTAGLKDGIHLFSRQALWKSRLSPTPDSRDRAYDLTWNDTFGARKWRNARTAMTIRCFSARTTAVLLTTKSVTYSGFSSDQSGSLSRHNPATKEPRGRRYCVFVDGVVPRTVVQYFSNRSSHASPGTGAGGLQSTPSDASSAGNRLKPTVPSVTRPFGVRLWVARYCANSALPASAGVSPRSASHTPSAAAVRTSFRACEWQ